MKDKSLLKSYVWHGEQCFYISTIERDSSAAVEPPAQRFAETIVWTYDWPTSTRGEIVATAGSGPAFRQHFEVCEQLFRHGKVKGPTDNE